MGLPSFFWFSTANRWNDSCPCFPWTCWTETISEYCIWFSVRLFVLSFMVAALSSFFWIAAVEWLPVLYEVFLVVVHYVFNGGYLAFFWIFFEFSLVCFVESIVSQKKQIVNIVFEKIFISINYNWYIFDNVLKILTIMCGSGILPIFERTFAAGGILLCRRALRRYQRQPV